MRTYNNTQLLYRKSLSYPPFLSEEERGDLDGEYVDRRQERSGLLTEDCTQLTPKQS